MSSAKKTYRLANGEVEEVRQETPNALLFDPSFDPSWFEKGQDFLSKPVPGGIIRLSKIMGAKMYEVGNMPFITIDPAGPRSDETAVLPVKDGLPQVRREPGRRRINLDGE